MTRRAHLLCATLLGVALLVDYGSHVAHAGFVYQDAHWQDQFGGDAPPSLSAARSRPLMQWTWWAQSRLAPSAQAFHAVTLALHVLAAALLWLLARRLGASPVAAWLAAAIFLLDVATVETAAYAASRTESFAAIGVLAAVAALAGPWSVWTPMLVGGAWAVGLAGKESAIAFIALAALIVGVRRIGFDRWSTRVGGGVIDSAAIVIVAGFVALAGVVGVVAEQLGMIAPHPVAWALLQGASAWRVTFVALTGVGASVEFDYAAVSMGARVAAALLSIGLLEVAWRARHRWPLATLGVLWVAACVLPRLIVWTPDVMNEHQGYLLLPGWALVCAAFVDGPEERPCM